MQGVDFREFLTHEERELMDALVKKAEERKRKEEEVYSRQYIMLECQCGCLKHMDEGKRKEPDSYEDMQELLSLICDFCRKHGGICHRDREDEGDDELPFG